MTQEIPKDWSMFDSPGARDFETNIGKEEHENMIKEKLEGGFLNPGEAYIEENRENILEKLRNEGTLIVPMRETGSRVEQFISHAANVMGKNNIIVINNGSDNVAVNIANQYAEVVDYEEILQLIDWDKLKPILNLDKIPKGKGLATWTGYIMTNLLEKEKGEKKLWRLHHDAEFTNTGGHSNLYYMGSGFLEGGEEASRVAIAKVGRNNDGSLAVRSALAQMARWPDTEGLASIKKRAVDLTEKTTPYIWMLTGQFAMRAELLDNMPMPNHYLMETCSVIFTEDMNGRTGQRSFQVVNPNPCGGGDNSNEKEGIIVTNPGHLLIELAAYKPLPEWNIHDVAKYNKKNGDYTPIYYFDHQPGQPDPQEKTSPVKVKMIPTEKMLPSVNMLFENSLIDVKKGRDFVKKYI
ncbi:MAG: hypothetical protein GF332_00345 [Candidatus Moranbacteria bacterium]|nr:hypothetical protein [Candidatus Moranbacteria bacterium]